MGRIFRVAHAVKKIPTMAVNIDTDWRGAHFSEKLQIRIEERTNGEAWPSKIVSSDISTIKRWRQRRDLVQP